MIIPIYDIVLLPNVTNKVLARNITKKQLEEVMVSGEDIVLLPLKNGHVASPSEKDFYPIGLLVSELKVDDSSNWLKLSAYASKYAVLDELIEGGEYLNGKFSYFDEVNELTEIGEKQLLTEMENALASLSKHLKSPKELMDSYNKEKTINEKICFLAPGMSLSPEERYLLMSTENIKDRVFLFLDFVYKTEENVKLQVELNEHIKQRTAKNFQLKTLQEQKQLINERLEKLDSSSKFKKKDYEQMIDEMLASDEVKAQLLEELEKLKTSSSQSSDYNVAKNYIDFALALPWGIYDEDSISISKAEEILDSQHYGLKKVKERIIQHLAVMKLKKDNKGSILLLVGPPGTGKTSLGKSVAKALSRKYTRISLGGVRDEAQIRGHRRTYVGALSGRILKAIKDCGSSNPVMVLDEVDKLMAGMNGDPASALLEVLDPEQNKHFTDHYLDMPFDLSGVLFIATANSFDRIPKPLLDRMEVINISSYTSNEKLNIAKNHLLPKTVEEHGIKLENLQIDDEVLALIIDEYTRESGVRGLKKQLDTLARHSVKNILTNEENKNLVVKKEDLKEYLGKKVAKLDLAKEHGTAGIVTGLAWTPVGGKILFIEATDMAGNGKITLTGKLGDVMQESAKIALSLLKSRFELSSNLNKRDIHIHVPSGAVPKDGPSAGITIFTALASKATGIPVSSELAMTGEISLRGIVMPIGGLKEKLIAANSAGIKKVLIPVDNIEDLDDIPKEVKDSLEIIAVKNIEEVIKETLRIDLPTVGNEKWI